MAAGMARDVVRPDGAMCALAPALPEGSLQQRESRAGLVLEKGCFLRSGATIGAREQVVRLVLHSRAYTGTQGRG
jgi:hypothetical protein